MRLIIAGTRTFKDYAFLDKKLNVLIAANHWKVTEIVSGGARGADKLGEQFAARHGIDTKIFMPNWNQGYSAGPERNKAMAEYAAQDHGALACFWDGASTGSASMIAEAQKVELAIHVIDIMVPFKKPQKGMIAVMGVPHLGWHERKKK